jgi:2'-5' RNA ligase
MRLFVAVELSDPVRASLEEIISRLRHETARANMAANARFIATQVAHLTLAFLGETAEERLPDLCSSLERTEGFPSFEFALSGLGAFPSAGRAKVLWAGVAAGAGRLGELAGAIRRNLSGSFPLEEREYIPHITVCRFRRAENINRLEVYGSLQETEIGRCRVNRFILMRSILKPGGAVHEPVRAFSLAEGGS